MIYELVQIEGVDSSWETAHRVRALMVKTPGAPRGKSLVLEALAELKRTAPGDYKKILKGIRMVAGYRRVVDPKYVKKDKTGRPVYELRADKSSARLFFFYTDEDEIVVATNHYWKTKSSEREQDREFERCARLREDFMRARREEKK